MSDLTDAIRWWDHWVKPSAPSNELTTLVAAARRVAEAPEVWWCETHECTGSDLWCQAPERHWEDCEMVRKLLVDP